MAYHVVCGDRKRATMFFKTRKQSVSTTDNASAPRRAPMQLSGIHFDNQNSYLPPFADHLELATFGMGCFWGAERIFWQTLGVHATAVGYEGGHVEHATYEEVCSGRTGHAEVVLVIYDPAKVSYEQLLKAFWEGHDPTQGMRQGNDRGTQYRSAIYTHNDTQQALALSTKAAFQESLNELGYGAITTDIEPTTDFYYAEEYHQQYLGKNPAGYCGITGTGASCPVGVA